MRKKLNIPQKVKTSINKHLKESISNCVENYLDSMGDEDTITGDLGASLRTKKQKVLVERKDLEKGSELPTGFWKWSISYKKFRGRGNNAEEKIIGADGIFELEVNIFNQIIKKSILFQAKNNWYNANNDLLTQCIKLSTWREASFVLNYTAEKFEAFKIDDILISKGNRNNINESISLDMFLEKYFLSCLIGDIDLNYYAPEKKLMWMSHKYKVATIFPIRHRIKINVDAPNRKYNKPYYKEIDINDIYKYRMDSSPEEILSL